MFHQNEINKADTENLQREYQERSLIKKRYLEVEKEVNRNCVSVLNKKCFKCPCTSEVDVKRSDILIHYRHEVVYCLTRRATTRVYIGIIHMEHKNFENI